MKLFTLSLKFNTTSEQKGSSHPVPYPKAQNCFLLLLQVSSGKQIHKKVKNSFRDLKEKRRWQNKMKVTAKQLTHRQVEYSAQIQNTTRKDHVPVTV